MNDYQIEQLTALGQVKAALGSLTGAALSELRAQAAEYLEFRRRVDTFLARHFGGYCTLACYQNQRSACCSKDGIIVFWADVVVNALHSHPGELDAIQTSIRQPFYPHKCIFLAQNGCLWRVRPLLCTMFLCDGVYQSVLGANLDLQRQWEALLAESKTFRWPDRPVMFDALERFFMDLGCRSTLMHLHTSPGLLRVKRLAEIAPPHSNS